MVRTCAAFGCTFRDDKTRKFHKFPTNNKLRQNWIVALKRDCFNPSKTASVCNSHFLNTDYTVNVHGNKVLKREAIPSIFNFPERLLKTAKRRLTATSKNAGVSIIAKTVNMFNSSASTSQESVLEEISVSPLISTTPEPTFSSNQSRDQPQDTNTPAAIRVKQVASRKREPYLFGDFTINDLSNPTKKAKFWEVSHKMVEQQKKRIKFYETKLRRVQKKVLNLQQVINHLVSKNTISSDCSSILKETLPHAGAQMLLRNLENRKSKKYPAELRSFALTLNFYSNSAYNYVRKTFGKGSLPHINTLRSWISSVDGSPGYTEEAIRAIKIKVELMKLEGKKLFCALMMDEMAIREHIQWNGKRQLGYINYGTGIPESDMLPKAKDALVFMLVGINTNWKVPIAYFLINGLTAKEKANLVNGCFRMLESTGVKIKTLTFDGTSTNISMMNELGANFSWPDLNTFILHPVSKQKIYIMLDACHMMKLCRNTLGDWGYLYDIENTPIEWKYFKKLVEIQESSGLHCATKLRSRHLNYCSEKMKVKLATQTFSKSVSDAFLFLKHDLNIPDFENCEATAIFCEKMNNIFDFLNTRNFYAKTKYHQPLKSRDFQFVRQFVSESIQYLASLKDRNQDSLIHSRRRTGFLGLIVCLKSIEGLYEELVLQKEIDFLLTYKMSQDHLEMWFSVIRSRGGHNNNPTAAQFEGSYKRVLINAEIKAPATANCLAQDMTSILCISSNKRCHAKNFQDIDNLCQEGVNVEEDDIPEFNVMYKDYIEDVSAYIAGFVVRSVTKNINCEYCSKALTSENSLSNLLSRKNRGKLIKPSADVVHICKIAEKIIRQTLNFSESNLMSRLTLKALRLINFNFLFINLHEHFLNQEVLKSHSLQIVKLILYNYFTCRLHYINQIENASSKRIRQIHTKLVLFQHQ